MRMERATRRLLIISILCAVISIVYVYNEKNRLIKTVDHRLLDIAERSHFIGCARVTLAFESCKQLSKQYREEYAKSSQLEDKKGSIFNESSN